MGALLYLSVCSVRNRTRVRLRRLKEPRYLIGLVAGLGYLAFLLWQPGASRRPGGPPTGVISAIDRARLPVEAAGAVALFVVAALAWVWPGKSRPALAFSKADVQFLFPAPFTRRQLIRYKVLRSQVGAFVGSAIMTVFFRPASVGAGLTFFLGIAITMAIINLHLTGVSLSRESLGTHGRAGLARQWLPVAIVLAAVVVLAGTVLGDWQVLSSLATGSAVFEELGRLAGSGAAAVVLWPFRAVSRLPLSATPAEFLTALPWAVALLVLNYLWVVRSDARFEEASAELAEKVAKLRTGLAPSGARVKRALTTPFKLGLDGRPETAILWKNLILLGRYASLRTLLRFVPIFVVFGILISQRGGRGGVGAMFAVLCAVVFVITTLMGPQLARNDLRQDLAHLALLRTWPVSGAAIVRGEVMAPAVLLTVIAWLCALGGVIFAASVSVEPTWVLAAAIVAPGVILVQVLAQNAIAVVWPSWVTIGAARARGIDVMGQRLIMVVGMLVVLAVAVLPAAMIGAGVGFAFYAVTGRLAVIAPAVAATVALLAEAFVASEVIGRMLDRTDVSAIDAAE